MLNDNDQSFNGTRGNAVPPPPIYCLKRSPTSDCYKVRERYTTIVRGSDLNLAFPPLILCFNHW